MGTLVAMRYPTTLFAKLADHTYVRCGNGGKAWGCWGGKTGGRVLRQGPGSTRRADLIAETDEKAGIRCYLINGVCHQAANRILLPAGITVRGARGYSVSEALFGPYGRVGFWPCKSPFHQHSGVTGDLPACSETRARRAARRTSALSSDDKLDFQYIQGVLKLYGKGRAMMKSRSASTAQAQGFHLELFLHMARFHLGARCDRTLTRRLKSVRARTERQRMRTEAAYGREELSSEEFAATFDAETVAFQEEMAGAMSADLYRSLFDLEPGDTVVLADPRIVRRTRGAQEKRRRKP